MIDSAFLINFLSLMKLDGLIAIIFIARETLFSVIYSPSGMITSPATLTSLATFTPIRISLSQASLLSKINFFFSSSSKLSLSTSFLIKVSKYFSLFSFLSFFFLAKIWTSTTTPSTPTGTLNEESFTSLAFSPKMANKSFSSGVSAVSPLGVTLPTKISPGLTYAPTLITPCSSRFVSCISLIPGIFLVISSGPSFVSLASISNSSIWIDVNTSSLTSLSEITIASSKL